MEKKNVKFYSLSNAWVFKKIIADSKDPKVLDKILSDILEQEVKVVKFLPTELNMGRQDDDVIDVIVETKDHERIFIDLCLNLD